MARRPQYRRREGEKKAGLTNSRLPTGSQGAHKTVQIQKPPHGCVLLCLLQPFGTLCLQLVAALCNPAAKFPAEQQHGDSCTVAKGCFIVATNHVAPDKLLAATPKQQLLSSCSTMSHSMAARLKVWNKKKAAQKRASKKRQMTAAAAPGDAVPLKSLLLCGSNRQLCGVALESIPSVESTLWQQRLLNTAVLWQ